MLNWIKDKTKHILADLKRAHRSVTIWFNGLIATAFFLIPEAIAYLPQLKDYVSEDMYKTGMVVLLVGNMILRFKTASALRNK